MTDEASRKALADELHLFIAAAPHDYSGHNIELFERCEAALRSLQPGTLARERAVEILLSRSGLVHNPRLYEDRKKQAELCIDAILALTPSHEAGTQEPVAWLCWYQGNCDATVVKSRMEDWVRLGRKVEPAYAAPAPHGAMRERAEK